jgi:Ethanolamine utilization protein EutJ (predicted chaperonin)
VPRVINCEFVCSQPVTHHISPEQIGAYIIAHLRSRVHASTGQVISACVLSAPAEFDARRRNATGDAARAAGMQVTAMISEPTAAALAYGLHKRDNVQTVVVVDLGTFIIHAFIMVEVAPSRLPNTSPVQAAVHWTCRCCGCKVACS